MTPEEMTEFFGEVISSYPDSQACEDGVLVPITQQDRVTRACWEWMAESLGDSPPNCWAVDMLGWFGAKNGDDRALAASKGLMGSWSRQARKVWEENVDGGVFVLVYEEVGGVIVGLEKAPDEVDMNRLWLIPNEVGGMTLMFPSDY